MEEDKQQSLTSAHHQLMPLFTTNLENNSLFIPNVVLNNKQVLERFQIKSLCDSTLRISLGSDLGSQITFQDTNENLDNIEELRNTENFNQLFNLEGLMNEVVLKPGETKNIVVALRPKPYDLELASTPKESKFLFSQLNANIFLTGETIDRDPPQRQDLVVNIFTKICRSFLETDVHQLDFDDCIPGEKYVRDFTVWNRSEIPLSFSLGVKSKSCSIEFTKYDTGSPIVSGTVAAYSPLRIRVTFKPLKVGEFDSFIYVENKNDENNIEIIKVHANVSNERHEDGITVDCGNEIDFGNCYRGYSNSIKIIRIKNVTQEPLDVFFGSDLPDDVTFNLKTDFDAEELKEKESEQPQSPTHSNKKTREASHEPTKQQHEHRIEEISLSPGSERTIEVSYSPSPESGVDEEMLAKLVETSFRIYLKCKDKRNNERKYYSKTISCKARVCTSLVEISPLAINFGDSNIGSVKYATVKIRNKSELPTKIAVRLISKIVSCATKEVTLAPKQTFDLKFGISPRKVNPYYRKQITVVNLYNQANENIIEVRSNNIDENMLTFHALFYDVLASSHHNFAKSIDFDTVVVNDISLRSIVIKNIHSNSLTLQLSTSNPQEIVLYQQNPNLNGQLAIPLSATTKGSSGSEKKEQAIQSIEERQLRLLRGQAYRRQSSAEALRQPKSPVSGESPHWTSFDPHVESLINSQETMASDDSYSAFHNYLQSLVKAFEDVSKSLPEVGDSDSEEKYVRFKLEIRKHLEAAIQDNLLVPCDTLEIKPESEAVVYVVFKPQIRNFATPALRKIEEKIYIRLLDFDKTIHKDKFESYADIPPRELTIQAKLGQSSMKFAQKNINFGIIMTNEVRQKTLSISNSGEVPLLYKINKTGSIASGDLHIDKFRMGIVRPYGNKELKFEFQPSLAGKFEDYLTIENVQDRSDNQVITFKANVRKPEHFSLRSTELEFGNILVNEPSCEQRIILTNTTKQKRTFQVKADIEQCSLEGCDLEYLFDLEESTGSSLETVKMEEEIEKLEHKLRICQRKGKLEKAAKLIKRIEEIKNELETGGTSKPKAEPVEEAPDTSEVSSSEDDKQSASRRRFKLIDNGVRFTVPPHGIQAIKVHIIPRKLPKFNRKIEKGTGNFLVFESRNRDILKIVTFSVTVYYDRQSFMQTPRVNIKPSGLPQPAQPSQPAKPVVPSVIKSIEQKLQKPKMIRQKSETEKEQTLIVDPQEINFGNIIVGQEVSSRFSITNISNTEVGFVILAPSRVGSLSSDNLVAEKKKENEEVKFQFSMKNGEVDKDQTVWIDFKCKAETIGLQRHQIKIQSLANKKETHTIYVLLKPTMPPPVRCLNIAEEDEVLDLGYCYLDVNSSGYSKVVPISLQNMRQDPINLTVSSNLQHQVFVAKDATDLTSPATNLLLSAGETRDVFVCLKPLAPKSAVKTGICREISGGIKLMVHDEKQERMLYQKAIQFKTIAGFAILHVSTKVIDLGCTHRLDQKYTGKFTVTNLNQQLPLEFSVSVISSPGTSANLKLSCTEGKLEGKQSYDIEYSMSGSTYGLHVARVKIINKMNRSQNHEVVFRLFVDDGSLATNLIKDESGIDRIAFDDVYVFQETESSLPEVVSIPDDETIQQATKYPFSTSMPPCFQRFTLKNNTMKRMMLVPQADFDLSVFTEGQLQHTAQHNEPLRFHQRASSGIVEKGLSVCGEPFELLPGSRTTVFLLLKGLPNLESLNLSEFAKSRTITSLHGSVRLIDQLIGDKKVVKIVNVEVRVCISEGRVVFSSLNLGKFGHTNSWVDVPFKFHIQNLSEVPLLFRMSSLPEEIQIEEHELEQQQNDVLICDPLATRSVHACLLANKFMNQHPGEIVRKLTITNEYNPLNKMTLLLRAQLTVCIWRFTRIDGDKLVLPMLRHPATQSSPPCDEWFTLQNVSDETVSCKIEASIDPSVSSFLSLEVLSFATSVPISSCTFQPGGVMDIRVRCTDKPYSRIPLELLPFVHPPSILPPSEEEKPLIRFGSLSMYSPNQPTQTIDIYGSLYQEQTFSLSVNRLLFHLPNEATAQRSFLVKNMTNHTLHFRVDPFVAEGYAISLTTVPLEGMVEPDGLLNVSVFIHIPTETINKLPPPQPNDLSLKVTDIYSPLVQQTICISLVSTSSHPSAHTSQEGAASMTAISRTATPELQQTPTSASPREDLARPLAAPEQIDPIIVLKGCTAISDTHLSAGSGSMTARRSVPSRYEIDLGQQNRGSKPVEWDLTIENISWQPIEYKLYTVQHGDNSWIQLSETRGVIEPSRDNNHVITLTFLTEHLGQYSSYLVIENCNNPKDIKTVRISMEVVASGNVTSIDGTTTKYFQVLVDGTPVEQNRVLNMGEVFLGNMVRHRYLDVVNLSDIPLDFQLTSNLPDDDPHSELHFSLSLTSLKSFHKLSIDAKSSARVYVLYRPLSFLSKEHAEQQAQQNNDNNANALVAEVQTVEIYIKCRLLKDFEEVVQLRADCVAPQMEISTDEVLFVGTDEPQQQQQQQQQQTATTTSTTSSRDSNTTVTKIRVDPMRADVVLRNLYDKPLQYVVVNDSLLFKVDTPKLTMIKRKNATHILVVKPIISKIIENQHLLSQGKYLEEHFTLYNMNNLREKYWISLRFTRGHLRQFYPAPGPKSAYPFNTLEDRVVGFLRDFNAYFETYMQRFSLTQLQLHSDDHDHDHEDSSSSSSSNNNNNNGNNNNESATTASGPSYDEHANDNDNNNNSSSSSSNKGTVAAATAAVRRTQPSSNYSSSPQLQALDMDSMMNMAVDIFRTQDIKNLYFDLRYITDELVFYGLKGKAGQTFFDLANLLYGVMLNNPIFEIYADPKIPTPPIIRKWGGQLQHFLNYFPDKREEVKFLRQLRDKFWQTIMTKLNM